MCGMLCWRSRIWCSDGNVCVIDGWCVVCGVSVKID